MTSSPLPPLPLKDGCLFIDNSFLETYQTCPRATEYSSLLRRVSSTSRPGLLFGELGHLVLEHRYRNFGDGEVSQEGENDQINIINDFYAKKGSLFPEDDWRTANWAAELFVKRYNSLRRKEEFNLLRGDDGKFLVEMPFCLPLFDYERPLMGFITDLEGNFKEQTFDVIKVFYTGRIDLPTFWNGQIIILDHKTAGMLGENFAAEHRVSPQQVGYCWAFEQLTSRHVGGFCINGIRTKEPPQYVTERKKSGKYNPDQWWEESFFRAKEYLQPYHIPEWKANTIALVQEFLFNYSRGIMPQRKKWCVSKYGKCQFYDVCDTPPNSRALMLEGHLYTENLWTPLKQPTQNN